MTSQQDKKPKNKFWKRLAIILFIVLAVPVFIIWYVLAQPTLASNSPSQQTINPESLKSHVTTLSQKYHPRDCDSLDNLNSCAKYIFEHFQKSGGQVSYQTFKVSQKEYKNVIVIFGEPSESRLVIGAHYDSYHTTPGADDNASGVAGLIELAYLLGKNPPKTTIELVAYTLEEPPYFASEKMGSAYHAEQSRKNNIDIRLMISLEMIGYFTDAAEQKYPFPMLKLFYPSQGNFIAVVSNFDNTEVTKNLKGGMKGTSDLPVYSMNAPEILPGVDFSDHRNYWKYNYPAVMITDSAFYRNFEYHKAGDTADRLDYDKMGKVVIAVFEAIKNL